MLKIDLNLKVKKAIRPNGILEYSCGPFLILFKAESDGGIFVQGYHNGDLMSKDSSLEVYEVLKSIRHEN